MPSYPSDLNRTPGRILLLLASVSPLTAKQIARAVLASPRIINTQLHNLRHIGLVYGDPVPGAPRRGEKTGRRGYALTDEGREYVTLMLRRAARRAA